MSLETVYSQLHHRLSSVIQQRDELLEALIAITSNPHIHLGDLIYTVREREGKGWDGPATLAWSQAVTAAQAAIVNATRRTELRGQS